MQLTVYLGRQVGTCHVSGVTNLTMFVCDLRTENEYFKKLTWHDAGMPQNEIHFKIGGDHAWWWNIQGITSGFKCQKAEF